MQSRKQERSYKIRVEFQDCQGRHSELFLTKQEMDLFIARLSRTFFRSCPKEQLLSAVEAASSVTEIEQLFCRYSVCDICNFQYMNLFGVRRIAAAVIEALYQFPRLRSAFCYIGSASGYISALNRLKRRDETVLREFHIPSFFAEFETVVFRIWPDSILQLLREQSLRNEDYLAMTVNGYGLLDAILFDDKDYRGLRYIELLKKLKNDEAKGFHPRGCGCPEYVVYHEIGHAVDSLCSFSKSAELREYWEDAARRADVRYSVSEYAAVSPIELVAEAFAAYMCSSSPGSVAREITEMMIRKYAQKESLRFKAVAGGNR